MVATVASMIGQFNMNNIQLLQDMGYKVDVACDFKDESVWTKERTQEFKKQLKDIRVQAYQIDFSRSPLKIKKHVQSYKQLKCLVQNRGYDFVHCHTPIAGAISRLVCKNTKTRCMYTAHGFHFYKGAPLKNWLLFFPIEWVCSWMTDVLITINKEDYECANRCLHAKRTEYVPGIGIDVNKFRNISIDKMKYKLQLDLPDDAIIVISVGELNRNKNHSLVIRALSKLKNPQIHYLIAGKGELKQELEQQAIEMGLQGNVHLLGYRRDVAELYKLADIYVLPSIREGLNVSLMEAMASGLPCVVSDIRGNKDLIEQKKGGYLIYNNDVQRYVEVIQKLCAKTKMRAKFGTFNIKKVEKYNKKRVENKMGGIYKGL